MYSLTVGTLLSRQTGHVRRPEMWGRKYKRVTASQLTK